MSLKEKNVKVNVTSFTTKKVIPIVNPLALNDTPKMMHPFMVEGMQEMKRKSSSVQTHRNIMLFTSMNHQNEKENEVSPMNFDENYLMFGGEKYTKVIPIGICSKLTNLG